jgi:hypothetical protein
LGGTGVITGPVTLNPGATLLPGPNLGALTVSNSLTLSPGSTTWIEVNAQSLGCDRVRGLTSMTYAGALVVTNLAGVFAGGQSFPVFSAASSSGNFSSISPASPGPNLAWNFNPSNGTLSVLAQAPPQITSVSLGAGGAVTLSGTGPSGQSYRILAASNVALPLANWSALATGSFAGGVFGFTDTQATNLWQRFYRVVTP